MWGTIASQICGKLLLISIVKKKSHWIKVLLSFDLSFGVFFNSSQVLDPIMGLEYFFVF